MNKTGIIYMATNNVNGKIYIGQTINNLSQRISGHCCPSKVNNKFHNAIHDYGIENFTWTILEENIPEESLDEKEISYIENYKSHDRDIGYNLLIGGRRNRRAFTEEVKERMSEKRKGVKFSQKARENMVLGKIKMFAENRKKYNGYAMSEETREKMRKANKGKAITQETKEKLRKAMIGKHPTEEAKKKMSVSKTGNKNHFFGKHHTDESNQRNRLSNHMNGPNKNNTSGYKGVSRMLWNKKTGGWRSTMRMPDGGRLFLGFFLDPKEAAKAYDCAIIAEYGEENVMTNKKLGLLEGNT